MIRKFITLAGLTGAWLMSTNAVEASHLGYPSTHLIFGRAYYYTLNFNALVTRLTGKDLKDGTRLVVDAKILASDTACANPQTFVINPGVGPQGIVFLASEPLDDGDLVTKEDRDRNTFSATATAQRLVAPEYRLREDLGFCKLSSGVGNWKQAFWEDLSPPCTKGGADPTKACYGAYTASTGYTRLAFWADNTLTIVPSMTPTQCTRTLKNPVPPAPEDPYTYSAACQSWTFVFLPTMFAMDAYVTKGGTADPDSHFYWSCQFRANNEPHAPEPGEPYSIANPPDAGWSGSAENPASYDCVAITRQQYEQL